MTASTSFALPAWLPIVISAIALLVSTTSLAWQMGKHRLDGPRLRLSLDPMEWVPAEMIHSGRSRSGELRTVRGFQDRATISVECARLTVENIGRAAVTVSTPGVAYSGGRRVWWSLRRWRRSVSPRLFKIEGIEPVPLQSSSPVRIDPRSSVSWVLDVHSVIPAVLEHSKRRRAVFRPCVSVPGRRFPVRGSWWRRWRVPRSAVSIRDFGSKTTLDRVILLELARNFDSESDTLSLLPRRARLAAAKLWARHESGAALDADAVETALEEATRRTNYRVEPPVVMADFAVATWLENHPTGVDWERHAEQYKRTLAQEARRTEREQKRSAPSTFPWSW
ncbi:hypothetical protein ACFVTZ_13655 [Cellulosimicrobium cellulans]|uniref:hypothetical protein n=1 Tax=Cellulosimicrobium cellulans TaxID=1710 RepID=UPI0036E818E3